MAWSVWRSEPPGAWRKSFEGAEAEARKAFADYLRKRAFAVMELRADDGRVVAHQQRMTARDRARRKVRRG